VVMGGRNSITQPSQIPGPLYAIMRTLLFIISLIIVASEVEAQTTPLKSTISGGQKKEFKNQGEQENYWTEELFKNQYSKETYSRFTSEITEINKTQFKFSAKILNVLNTSEELKSIFKIGIFYPSLIGGALSTISSSDTLTISNFEEVKFLSVDSTCKRFRFWLFRPGIANPQVYFIELTNINVTKSIDIITFIKGASLTFVKGAWIVL